MNASPCGPIIGIAMFSRTNCTPISATLCSLPGTTLGDGGRRRRRRACRGTPSSTRNVMKFRQKVEAADLQRRNPAVPDEVVGRGRMELRDERGTAPFIGRTPARRAGTSTGRPACARTAASSRRRAARSSAGTSAAMNATTENHAGLVEQRDDDHDDPEPDDEPAEPDRVEHGRRDRRRPARATTRGRRSSRTRPRSRSRPTSRRRFRRRARRARTRRSPRGARTARCVGSARAQARHRHPSPCRTSGTRRRSPPTAPMTIPIAAKTRSVPNRRPDQVAQPSPGRDPPEHRRGDRPPGPHAGPSAVATGARHGRGSISVASRPRQIDGRFRR